MVLLINNFGGLSSLNGLKFGVSILKLADTSAVSGRTLLELIDAPAQAVGWPQAISRET